MPFQINVLFLLPFKRMSLSLSARAGKKHKPRIFKKYRDFIFRLEEYDMGAVRSY